MANQNNNIDVQNSKNVSIVITADSLGGVPSSTEPQVDTGEIPQKMSLFSRFLRDDLKYVLIIAADFIKDLWPSIIS